MRIPSDDEIRALHQRLAPSPEAFALVHTHCLIVADLAAGLATGREDRALVRAGALLHDIGVYRLNGEPYIRHGLLGHDVLRELGFAESLCRFCSCHTGVGLTGDDIKQQSLPLPPGDYVARTAEERLVMYADKFHSKTSPPTFVSAASYRAKVSRFGAGKTALFDEMVTRYGEPDLAGPSATHGHRID